jgi:hypothetical protein
LHRATVRGISYYDSKAPQTPPRPRRRLAS